MNLALWWLLMLMSIQTDLAESSASHVDLSFKDEYLSRSDMWRLAVSQLSNKTVYKGQKILFMGTIKTQVASVFVNGHEVQSAFFSSHTKPMFRSESAKFVLFIQVSREMWDFISEGSGEIMFSKVVNGFLPALFKNWAKMRAKHLVSIVLFTRIEYDVGFSSDLKPSQVDGSYHTGTQPFGKKKPYKDFYRVVVSEMASGEWKTILHQLKREFRYFRRDTSTHRLTELGLKTDKLEANPSLAMHGNLLEAINMATSQFAQDHIDRDLMRTGMSLVVITPSPGIFDVDHDMLRLTTDLLLCNGIGVDLVCLPKMPLHSAPIFRYRNPDYIPFPDAVQSKSFQSEESTLRQSVPLSASASTIGDSVSPSKASMADKALSNNLHRNGHASQQWCYAMPKWVDVSFWTGTLHHRAAGLSKHGRSGAVMAERFDDFDVRCKMYELEMSSIVGDAMTEISITSLHQDPLFHQIIAGSRETTEKRRTEPVRREKVYAAFTEHVYGPARASSDRHSTSEGRALTKSLERYDLLTSEIHGKLRSVPRHKLDKKLTPGSTDTVRNMLAENSVSYGGFSIGDDHSHFPTRASLEANPNLPSLELPKEDEITAFTLPRTPLRSRKNSDVTPPTQPPISTMTAAPITKETVSKGFKFGRQISFGKFGFGIAAPKASTAEIRTEHARANAQDTRMTDSISRERKTIFANLSSPSAPPQNKINISSAKSRGDALVPQDTNYLSDRQSNGSADESRSPSRPITIRSAIPKLNTPIRPKPRSRLSSVNKVDSSYSTDVTHALRATKADDYQKVFNSKLLAGAMPDTHGKLSHVALAPWPTVINPSNPKRGFMIKTSTTRRWQYLYPEPTRLHSLKWRSLCSPASIPIVTVEFPTKHQLESEYQQNAYNISRNLDDDFLDTPQTEEFIRELIGLRLSQGFQIVTGPKVAEAFGQKALKIANGFDRASIAGSQLSFFMSRGNVIHQLSCTDGTEVEVTVYRRKLWQKADSPASSQKFYTPAIRTIASASYLTRQLTFEQPKDDCNWNFVDNFVAGFDDQMTEHLRFWGARFVLIPIAQPIQGQRRRGEDTPEEIRLEGLRKITQMWQRNKIIPLADRNHQDMPSRKVGDPNPLDIVFRTEDPSMVITHEIEALQQSEKRGTSVDRPRFRRATVELSTLADAIQAPVAKGGVRMQNRRWHFRLHYNCFVGSDMTTWLIENFEDIEDREDAVDFGNRLMVRDDQTFPREKDMGLFVHVERRHPFRDGQYFYQVSGEHAKRATDVRSGWFAGAKRRDASNTSNAAIDFGKESPRPERLRSSSAQDEGDSGASTPRLTGGQSSSKAPVALSKAMKLDVDPRKKSYRREIINLHYDRVHNPDSCYHIRIDWVSATAKLIEDAVESWATTAERYGLRLVEAPIGEACMIAQVHPFREPYEIKLACRPPAQRPRTQYDIHSFEPQINAGYASRHYYQKAILRKFDFVLDTEAARNFPPNANVTYSWGKPEFRYTQYIHRTGVILAEITDEGNFILVANRLCNNRTAAAREQERTMQKDATERRFHGIAEHHHANANPAASHQTQKLVYSPLLRPVQGPVTSPVLKPLALAGDSMASSLSLGDETNPVSLPPSSKASLSLVNSFLPTPYSNMKASSSSASIGGSSPIVAQASDPIRDQLEAFCSDAHVLELFYREVYTRVTTASGALTGFGNGSVAGPTSPHLLPTSESLLQAGLFASPRHISPVERDREMSPLMEVLSTMPPSAGQSTTGLGNLTIGGSWGSSLLYERDREAHESQSLGGTAAEMTGLLGNISLGSPIATTSAIPRPERSGASSTSASMEATGLSSLHIGSGIRGALGAFGRRSTALSTGNGSGGSSLNQTTMREVSTVDENDSEGATAKSNRPGNRSNSTPDIKHKSDEDTDTNDGHSHLEPETIE